MARRSADARTKPDGRLAEKILEGDFQRVERECLRDSPVGKRSGSKLPDQHAKSGTPTNRQRLRAPTRRP